jgi:Type III restriction enzyme, res subunit
MRLQQLVAGWRGAERGEALSALHDQCRAAAGPGGAHLLPDRLLMVKDLDGALLHKALGRLNGLGRGAALTFRIPPAGRFVGRPATSRHAPPWPTCRRAKPCGTAGSRRSGSPMTRPRPRRYPYQLSSGQTPRYYQEAAINRAVIAVLQAQRNLREPRILLTLATGTGKTLLAFQIVWKLRRTGSIGNVLFLTDRDYLLGQAMDNAFTPFGDARDRIRGTARTSRDILFATYQSLADEEGQRGLYRRYPKDFFSLIIVDECHRGSAQDDSNWRSILEHFKSAVHIGLTATPLRNDNVQTYQYFGNPVAIYSLRRGITDGSLAPDRVRRVLMGHALPPEESTESGTTAAPLSGTAVDGGTRRCLARHRHGGDGGHAGRED